VCRGFCLATTDPHHSYEVEAIVELVTVRLADLVSARLSDGAYKLVHKSRTRCSTAEPRGLVCHAPHPNAKVTAADF
jgi:hypothetical protein